MQYPQMIPILAQRKDLLRALGDGFVPYGAMGLPGRGAPAARWAGASERARFSVKTGYSLSPAFIFGRTPRPLATRTTGRIDTNGTDRKGAEFAWRERVPGAFARGHSSYPTFPIDRVHR